MSNQKQVWRMEPSIHGWSVFKTIRTKAAKYERVECSNGCSDGYFESYYKCPCCHGKGYTLEKIK